MVGNSNDGAHEKSAVERRSEPWPDLTLLLIEILSLLGGVLAVLGFPDAVSWSAAKAQALSLTDGAWVVLVLGVLYAVDKWSAELDDSVSDAFKALSRGFKLFAPMFTVGAAMVVLVNELGGFSETMPWAVAVSVFVFAVAVAAVVVLKPRRGKRKAS